jgi:hypothetical protein
LLKPEDVNTADLYPIVSADRDDHELEFNFGADLATKPFEYELAHLKIVDV